MVKQSLDTLQTQASSSVDSANKKVGSSQELPTTKAIQAWLSSYLAELLDIEPDEVDIRTPFQRYGLDSAATVGLIGDMEGWLKRELSPTLLYDYPTIEALAQNLADEIGVQ